MSKALHLDCKVRGLATYEDFREVAIERVIKPQHVVSLDLQDVKAICQSGDVFDALSFDITKDKQIASSLLSDSCSKRIQEWLYPLCCVIYPCATA